MMNSGKKVSVIGAGFSGLVSAYYLRSAGYDVDVYEARDRAGGIIETIETGFGRVERAANGILSSERVEKLFQAAKVGMVESGKMGKKRYFFRGGRVRRWPLSISETFAIAARIPKAKKSPPREGETVEEWANRVLGKNAHDYLIAPALQGIYAGDSREMSAELIFGRFFEPKPKSAQKRKSKTMTIAPAGGMSALIHGLQTHLEEIGVRFHFRTKVEMRDLSGPVVVATSLPATRELLTSTEPASLAFKDVTMLSLACVHLAFPRSPNDPEGFGCLFTRGEGIRALGVLYENSVFRDRSVDHLERWILGGATDPSAAELSDEELIAIVRKDRLKQLGVDQIPTGSKVTRVLSAYPHYDIKLQEALRSPALNRLRERGIFLVGNYLGKLGLSGILEEAEKLPSIIAASGGQN